MKINFNLFANKKKDDRHPDYKMFGDEVITITEPGSYQVALWRRVGKQSGKEYLYVVLEPARPANPQATPNAPRAPQAIAPRPAFPTKTSDEDLPF